MNRGDRRELVFEDDEDRRMIKDVLGEASGKTGWGISMVAHRLKQKEE
jgi:hypothetical protein